MDSTDKAINWIDGEFQAATVDPSVSVAVIAEEAPTLTVPTIVGVTIVILLTIALVFLLGVLIDWRQQRLLEKQLAESKRVRSQRRANISTHPQDEHANIADNMEESAMTIPPAEMLRNIP